MSEGDLPEEPLEALDPPGVVPGIQHTFTADSLIFTWQPAEGAEAYRLTLLLAGETVGVLTTSELVATFQGLEDGTAYTLAIQAENAQGGGPIAYYQAATQYLPPAMPINLRQFEERIIAVICQWDLVDPEKVFDVHVRLMYGDRILYDEILPPDQRERTYPVPMASTNYLLWVRAGNPGGWSPWAEAWVHTEDFPLVDSRLAVMAAAYLEDYLYPDEWNGAPDASNQGAIESLGLRPAVTIRDVHQWESFVPPEPLVVKEATGYDWFGVRPDWELTAREYELRHELNHYEITGANATFEISAQEFNTKFNLYPFETVAAIGVIEELSAFEVRKQYRDWSRDTACAGSAYFVLTATERTVQQALAEREAMGAAGHITYLLASEQKFQSRHWLSEAACVVGTFSLSASEELI